MEQLKRKCSHTKLHIPEVLVFEILLRLPAKSVARFRCVSTTWLSISTDPSFILAHALRAPKSLLVRSIPTLEVADVFHNVLFSFSVSGIDKQRLHQIPDLPRSCCNRLVFLWRPEEHPSDYYVLNLLTGLHIDLPNPEIREDINSTLELYYHGWTGEYRVINLREYEGPPHNHLDAEVLSLAGAPSWRQIKATAPFVYLCYWQSRILMNDHLYWTCQQFSKAHTILVFDILKETFSLMDLPSYNGNSFPSFAATGSYLKYGLVDIDSRLCCWVVYRDKCCLENIMIVVWTVVDGAEKWKKAHSLCLVDERRWAFCFPSHCDLLIDCCLCIKEGELLFLFDSLRYGIYLFHWDLESGRYWTELVPSGFNSLIYQAHIYRETLINVCHSVAPS